MHDFEQRPIQRLGSLLQSTGPSPRPEPSQQPCPVCGEAVTQQKCKVVCRSSICVYRIIYNCSEF